MSNKNNTYDDDSDERDECPLCMDPLVDDVNFFPCSCTYQAQTPPSMTALCVVARNAASALLFVLVMATVTLAQNSVILTQNFGFDGCSEAIDVVPRLPGQCAQCEFVSPSPSYTLDCSANNTVTLTTYPANNTQCSGNASLITRITANSCANVAVCGPGFLKASCQQVLPVSVLYTTFSDPLCTQGAQPYVVSPSSKHHTTCLAPINSIEGGSMAISFSGISACNGTFYTGRYNGPDCSDVPYFDRTGQTTPMGQCTRIAGSQGTYMMASCLPKTLSAQYLKVTTFSSGDGSCSSKMAEASLAGAYSCSAAGPAIAVMYTSFTNCSLPVDLVMYFRSATTTATFNGLCLTGTATNASVPLGSCTTVDGVDVMVECTAAPPPPPPPPSPPSPSGSSGMKSGLSTMVYIIIGVLCFATVATVSVLVRSRMRSNRAKREALGLKYGLMDEEDTSFET